jgi:hypothetical protein
MQNYKTHPPRKDTPQEKKKARIGNVRAKKQFMRHSAQV